MPAINLTNNTDLSFSAASADDNATLNRYLKSVLTLKTPPSFDAISQLLVKDQNELSFPLTLSAAGEAKFALKSTSFNVGAGASASIGLIRDDAADFVSDLQAGGYAPGSGLVSLAIETTLSAGDNASAGDVTFGLARSASVTVTSYHSAAADEKLLDAVEKAAAALTIPHDVADLKSIPPGAICRVEGASALTFNASATYSFVNDPLASVAIEKLPALSIQSAASATLEATVTHTAGHVLTVARLPGSILHLAVHLKKSDDRESSLTVSSGIGANIGSYDALGFLLDKINPNSAAQADAIASQMKDAAGFKSDIKSAIDQSLAASLGASIKAGLDVCNSLYRAFLYEIDLGKLDDSSTTALQRALTGDFTALTKAGPPLNGIRQLESTLTTKKEVTRTFTLHLLGIFNAASVHDFVAKSKINFTTDSHELVLSDESVEVLGNNLAAEKLRKVLLKAVTLTLPASANTKDADTPLTLAYLDREGSAASAKIRQFANALQFIGAPESAAAAALAGRNLNHYGACSLFLGLDLNPSQCRHLFLGEDGKPLGWMYYVDALCSVERNLYSGLDRDPEHAFYLTVFNATEATWAALREAGAAPNKIAILKKLGMTDTQAQLALADVVTAIWWAQAMADYSVALAKGGSLAAAGKSVVKDSDLGYDEPWMILTAWQLAGKPAIRSEFSAAPAAAVSAAS